MVNYNCEICGKKFTQKSHYTSHTNKKIPCEDNTEKIKEIVAQKVEEIKKDIKKDIEKDIKKDIEKEHSILIKSKEGIEFMKNVKDSSVDLILTDPPYIISKETGMNKHYNSVKDNEKNGIEFVKTEEDWEKYKKSLNKPEEELKKNKGKGWSKENYLKYGTILGKKYCNKTEYGEWDRNFTIEELEKFVKNFYDKLRQGGTLIIWFDIWKISILKDIMEKYKFKQIRFIEWVKTNPQPINSKINYLTNCREIALLGVKGGKPVFNSSYDKGIYQYPMASGKNKFHPTQKNLQLFEELITKHSNENDLVMDTFLGGGTTAIACKNTNRKFTGCEINEEFVKKVYKIIENS
jgi:DNA modification methylase